MNREAIELLHRQYAVDVGAEYTVESSQIRCGLFTHPDRPDLLNVAMVGVQIGDDTWACAILPPATIDQLTEHLIELRAQALAP